ncbi:uncharacterized protein DSM5745_07214 [Aspergillus mulundensis]|uniref:Apple domain-containing protein n=1 Tax=Aspergillus mulundensis TaxID=1810919 RepID=A0A3D8RKG7_9EURO|nr:hypothetical protein DSM5745_07214 [Aspergillus mulundensis]RDW74552.1 hypothetical protein DSM5745_07214 [Aspergillus mulundensis]
MSAGSNPNSNGIQGPRLSWDGLEVVHVPYQDRQPYLDVEYGKEAVGVMPLADSLAIEAVRSNSPRTFALEAVEAGETFKEGRRKRRICGLSPVVFWSVCALLVLVVIGAAVGGGVGGALSKNSDESSDEADTLHATATSTSDTNPLATSSNSSARETITPEASASPSPSTSTSMSTTLTASTTSSAPITSGTVGVAQNPCPGANSTLVTSSVGSNFIIQCNNDWPRGIEAADGSGDVSDLTRWTEYTLDDCIDRCVQYNSDLEPHKTRCKGVTYEANLTSSFGGGQGGNCFLKDKAGKLFPGSDTTMTAGVVAG